MGKRIRRTVVAAGVLALVTAAGCGANEPESTGYGDQAPAKSEQKKSTEQKKDHGDDHGSANAATAKLQPEGTGDPFADARTAAEHMPMTAAGLSEGFATAAKVEGSTNSDAAELRANLTYLLTEHVYLAGITVATAYATAPDSPEFEAAADTLDANSQAVASAVGSIAGKDKGKQFLVSWRSHINDFVDYAVAAKSKDEKGKAEAVDNLMAYSKTSGQFFSEITGGALPASAVQQEFETHIVSLAKAVDGFAAGDPKAYDDLKAAAGHMPMSAAALAGGITEAAKLEGDPNDAASELRSTLTAALTEHVYLASVAVFTAYTAGADSPAFEAAAATLDTNSQEIAAAVGSLSDAESEKAFLTAWRSHISDFVDYAVARAEKDDAGQTEALNNLESYTTSAGSLISQVSGGQLPAKTVSTGLQAHVTSLAGAIDSLAGALVK